MEKQKCLTLTNVIRHCEHKIDIDWNVTHTYTHKKKLTHKNNNEQYKGNGNNNHHHHSHHHRENINVIIISSIIIGRLTQKSKLDKKIKF